MSDKTASIKRVYYLLIALFWLATALPMALSVLLVLARGLTLFQVSLAMGVYSLTVVLLEIPTGGLADAVGRKKVTLLAYGLMLLSSLGYLVSFTFPVFLLTMILYGVGRALASGALDAWFIDSLQAADPAIDLQPVLATANTYALLALGSGLLLGSTLPQFLTALPPEGSAVLTPFSAPILAALAVKVVLLLLTILLVKEARPADGTTWRTGLAEMPGIIRTGLTLSRRNPTILLLLGASLAGGLVLSTLETFWQPHFAGLLGGSEGHSLFFGAVMGGNFLVGMAGNMLVTPLSRLLGQRRGLLCAIFQGVRGLMLLLLALQTNLPLAVLLFWLVYFNMGLIEAPHMTLFNREIPAAQRSAMLSIGSFVGYTGAFIGSIGLGYLAEAASISTAWIVAGAILLVSLGLYLQVDRREAVLKLREQLSVTS